ncbi:MAG: DUF86 domain-containing protein [Candidatus Gastranaerophilales bacterium]|nr:DUF86 domain-containing protein [Candidatus Gastranaerophilales bacterium]
MKNRKPIFFLEDIKTSIGKILTYTKDMSLKDFENDTKTIDAVERNFEIIGEAVKNLPEEIINKNKNIPFRQIAGMRDKLIHDYFGVDYEIVYKTIKDKLPEFRTQIKNIIKQVKEKE